MRAPLDADGRYRSEVLDPAFREGKLELLRQVVGRDPTFAAGDSRSDAWLMHAARHALLVDRGNEGLRRESTNVAPGWSMGSGSDDWRRGGGFGGPQSRAELEPFLGRLLTDVLPGPMWARRFFGPRFARSRARRVEGMYAQIGWSPLVPPTGARWRRCGRPSDRTGRRSRRG